MEAIWDVITCPREWCRGKVKIVPTADRWDTHTEVVCRKCDNVLCKAPSKTSKSGKSEQPFTEINIEEIYKSLVSGIGCEGL